MRAHQIDVSRLTWGANVQREGLDKYIFAVVCHTPTIAISSAYVGGFVVAEVNILFGWIGWAHFRWHLDFSDLFGFFLLDVQDSRPCVACLYRRKKGPSKWGRWDWDFQTGWLVVCSWWSCMILYQCNRLVGRCLYGNWGMSDLWINVNGSVTLASPMEVVKLLKWQ